MCPRHPHTTTSDRSRPTAPVRPGGLLRAPTILIHLLAPLIVLLVVFVGACTTSATTHSTTPATSRPAGPVVIKPVIEGWSPVRSVKRAAVYDVPPTWTVLSEDTIAGFETKSRTVVTSGAAEFGQNACGRNSNLALAGIRHAGDTDLAEDSQSIATEWADRAFRDDADRPPTPHDLTSRDGHHGDRETRGDRQGHRRSYPTDRALPAHHRHRLCDIGHRVHR